MDQKELMAALTAAAETPVSHVDLSASTQRIMVDMDTRKISGRKEFGVIKDHLAENIIFEVKRYKGDTDLAEKHCAIHWENGENGGVLPVTEVDLSEDGLILMRWELSDEFTQYKGQLAYALHFFSILDGGFTYHAATNAASGTLGDTLNASAHSQNKITPSEIEVYIAKMNELSAEVTALVGKTQTMMERAEAAAIKAEAVAEKAGEEAEKVVEDLTQSKADAIICQASGETVVATDSADAGLEQLKTYGWSVQETGTITDDEGNEIVIPNPEYPQPIVSAGQKLALGNQLLDLTEKLGCTSTDAVYESNYIYSSVIETKGNTSIYVKGDYKLVNSGVVRVGLFNKYPVVGDTPSAYREVQNGELNVSGYSHVLLIFSVYNMNTTKEQIEQSFMVNYDSTALPWEPYTGGVKAAYDVGISKKLTGKNLLKNAATSESNLGVTHTVNEDGRVIINGIASESRYIPLGKCYNLKPNTSYIVTGNGKSSNPVIRLRTFDKDGNVLSSRIATKEAGATFTTENNCMYADMHVIVYAGSAINNFVIEPMIRLASIEDDTYEPYTEQTLTLNRVLRGIPVKDASLATYTDADGQMWCADYIDAERGVLVQRVIKYEFTGKEMFTKQANTGSYNRYMITENNIGTKNLFRAGLCTDYIYKTGFETNGNNIDGYANCFAVYSETLRFVSNATDASEFSASMAGVKIYLALATPIETPLTDEEIAAYKALHSNKPTTVITNDAGCYMECSYVADTKNYIDNRSGEGGEEATNSLPEVTEKDNGKILQVVAGKWGAVAVTNGNEVAY